MSLENQNQSKNASMLGLTQALDLINSTNNPTPSVLRYNQQSPILVSENRQIKDQVEDEDLFDMKSTLFDLFANEDCESLREDTETLFDVETPNNAKTRLVKSDSIEILNSCVKSVDSGTRTRRLRFDEASIVETSGFKKSFQTEDSFAFKKKSRAVNDLSSSFSDTSGNKNKQIDSDDSEFNEVIGNNFDASQSQHITVDDEDEDEEEDDDDFEKDFIRFKSSENSSKPIKEKAKKI